MTLEPDLFRRLVGDAPLPLPALPDDLPGERREAGRAWVGRRATLYRVQTAGSTAEPVVVRDASPRAVGLLLSRELAPGESLVLSVPLAAGRGPLVAEVRVVRCAVGSDVGGERSFVVGAEFVRVIAAPSSGRGEGEVPQGS